MKEASWVPVAVDPLVPPARLGALLIERRTAAGVDISEMASRSEGMFSPTYLADAERGRVALDEDIIEHLVGLYEISGGPVVPARSELVLDLNRHELRVGDTTVDFESPQAEAILERYVDLVYSLRGARPGDDLVLRDADLLILADSLGHSPSDVRLEVRRLIEAPESVMRAKNVSRAKIVAAAGVLVGVTALGTLVLVGRIAAAPVAADSGVTEVLGTSSIIVASDFSAELGRAAESLVEFDFRGALPGWTFSYGQGHPDFLGVTSSTARSITVHVEPGSTPESVAAVLMHEVGHALDLERMTDTQRRQWIEMRDMPATWWPGDGLSDFAVGAGDFAEAVSAYTTGAPSRSVYGEFTEEQLTFVADILAAG